MKKIILAALCALSAGFLSSTASAECTYDEIKPIGSYQVDVSRTKEVRFTVDQLDMLIDRVILELNYCIGSSKSSDNTDVYTYGDCQMLETIRLILDTAEGQ